MALISTTADLALAVVQHLGVVDASETAADSNDATYITNVYNRKFDELASPQIGLAFWPRAEIPNAVFLIIRDLIANEVAGAFGEPVAPETKEGREQIILTRLRRHVRTDATGHPTQALYF